VRNTQNTTALITGGTSGIGRAAAQDFINNGATVITTGRFQDTVDATVKELGKQFHAVKLGAQIRI
jgi:NADP-dependent 3-hydroxy acid dehydrogenase YdfG